MGVNPRAGGGRGVRAGPPKLKDKHQKTKLELECLVFTRLQVQGLLEMVFNSQSHRRTERGGGDPEYS